MVAYRLAAEIGGNCCDSMELCRICDTRSATAGRCSMRLAPIADFTILRPTITFLRIWADRVGLSRRAIPTVSSESATQSRP